MSEGPGETPLTLEDIFPFDVAERSLRFESMQTDASKLVRETIHSVYRAHRDETDRLLAGLAQTRFQLNRVAMEASQAGSDVTQAALETIGDILQEVLDDYRVTVDDRTGDAWSTSMIDEIELRGHQQRKEIDEPQIAHMELPVVFRDNRLIAKGAAIVETPQRD